MTTKKENKVPKEASSSSREQEKRLMEKQPFESMSQVQNRYGKGRKKNGSDSANQDNRSNNH